MYKSIGPGEYLIGYVPSRNGSDYDATKEGVAYSELIDLLAREQFNLDEDFLIQIAGRVGSPGADESEKPVITAPSFITTRRNVLNAVRVTLGRMGGAWSARDAVALATNPVNAPALFETLLSLQQTPVHITGVVVKRII